MQVGFVAIYLASVPSLLALAMPIIENTINSFPDGESPVGRVAQDLDLDL